MLMARRKKYVYINMLKHLKRMEAPKAKSSKPREMPERLNRPVKAIWKAIESALICDIVAAKAKGASVATM